MIIKLCNFILFQFIDLIFIIFIENLKFMDPHSQTLFFLFSFIYLLTSFIHSLVFKLTDLPYALDHNLFFNKEKKFSIGVLCGEF